MRHSEKFISGLIDLCMSLSKIEIGLVLEIMKTFEDDILKIQNKYSENPLVIECFNEMSELIFSDIIILNYRRSFITDSEYLEYIEDTYKFYSNNMSSLIQIREVVEAKIKEFSYKDNIFEHIEDFDYNSVH